MPKDACNRTVASPHVRWTAVPVRTKGTLPRLWGEFRDDVLLLKDTRHPFWRNTLLAPNEFRYEFPTRPRTDAERALVARIRARVAGPTPLVVRLYVTPAARDEYYGRWVVGGLKAHVRPGASALHLLRLEAQDVEQGDASASAAKCRSRNEARHEAALRAAFPAPDWMVAHEPEGLLLDVALPTVVDGVEQDGAAQVGASYTCDFVVVQCRGGCARFCVESKPCEAHVTPAALVKCRLLRDRTLTRVLVLCGASEDEDRWYDLGPPGASVDDEGWCTDPWPRLGVVASRGPT